MKLAQFKHLVCTLSFGKRLPDAIYISWPTPGSEIPEELLDEIRRAETAAEPPVQWNLLKLHTKEYSISFLHYPDFDSDPHPALAHATKINLNSGRVIRSDYSERSNPPILHRKETFLPLSDPRVEVFKDLTEAEEEAGLYRDTSKIGHRLQWESLLRKKGLSYEGQSLVASGEASTDAVVYPDENVSVERHRTAIKRYDLSRPVKLLMKHGLLRDGVSFFDYGCGHGMDIEGLVSLGYDASGWDPAYNPKAELKSAPVVNLGYVLNVIEQPKEREAVLEKVFKLTERVLAVSVMVVGQENEAHTRRYGDGYITKAGTFQKFYAPGELEELVEDCINRVPVTLAPGICVVFKDAVDRESFVASRVRRHVDWTEIGNQLRFSKGKSREESIASKYDLHRELMDKLWGRMLDLGRLPEVDEFEAYADIQKNLGGIKRAGRLAAEVNGSDLFEESRRLRKEDVLSYLAMTHFERRFRQKDMDARTKRDVKAFFNDFQSALEESKHLLFASGDPDEIDLAVKQLDFGHYDQAEQHFSFHSSLLNRLPGILRVYVLCGVRLFGDLDEVDVIKIHIRSGKLTLQTYDDFEGNPVPELALRIKIDLRKFFVTVFEHSKDLNPQLLLFKERFLSESDEKLGKYEAYSRKLRKLGFSEETVGYGPRKNEFMEYLDYKGLTKGLRKKS